MTDNQLLLESFKKSLWENFKSTSLNDLETKLHKKDYPKIRGARKILKECIDCKVLTLRDRDWC